MFGLLTCNFDSRFAMKQKQTNKKARFFLAALRQIYMFPHFNFKKAGNKYFYDHIIILMVICHHMCLVSQDKSEGSRDDYQNRRSENYTKLKISDIAFIFLFFL